MRRWTERRALRARYRQLLTVVAIWAAITAALSYSVARSSLAWNRTDSIPVGFYAIRALQRLPGRGELVAINVPASVSALVTDRHYLRASEQVYKIVVALPGDTVCLDGARFVVNSTLLGPVLPFDREGRALPSWRFCGTVPADTFWLGTPSPRSFDSRYFGPVTSSAFLATLEPKWTF